MTTNPPSPSRPLSRDLFLRLLQTAVRRGESRFARQAALSWLAAYPGDLPVTLFYARILIQEGHAQQALPVLTRLCASDPEYLEAAQARLEAENLLHQQAERQKSAPRNPGKTKAILKEALGSVLALGGVVEEEDTPKTAAASEEETVIAWSYQIKQARQALHTGSTAPELEGAEAALQPALAASSSNPLVGITHLRILKAMDTPPQSMCSLADFYRQRSPDCLQFQLFLAEALVEIGRAGEAVALLHQSAAHDLTGQVAARLWGKEHPYRLLWPDRLELALDMAIPAPVAAAMGWNQLPYGELPSLPAQEKAAPAAKQVMAKSLPQPEEPAELPAAPAEAEDQPLPIARPVFTTIPETLRSVQAELERVAERLHQPDLARVDGRYPVYVILTTRRGLETQYGAQAEAIHEEIQSLAQAVNSRRDWHALILYADEGLPPDIPPARASDPWAIKLALSDLDAVLGKKGEMIGAVLIVGGPEVVPFHHLPNPVDDVDNDVPSDNPYATRDENYFVPEWPVGRLPGGKSKDSSGLLNLLKGLTSRHSLHAKSVKPQERRWWVALLHWLFRRRTAGQPGNHKYPSFGYSAEIWRKASQMVFRPIGEPRALRISPPLYAAGDTAAPLPAGKLAYFNLHGLVDAVEWYGQREPANGAINATANPAANVEYPVALRPQDIVNSGRAPEVVFSEACYGAHIIGKEIDEALALKFLQSGSQAVIGSTCTAYGSINTPLTAADFLGQAFWNALKQGRPAGEALHRAKVTLAKEMHRQQGFLDGEDQKTLISFVLYGDPLAQPLKPERQSKGATHPAILRPLKPPRGVKTVCDRHSQEDIEDALPAEVVGYVKSIVEQYLPGMEGAQVALSREHSDCNMHGHTCPTGQLYKKSADLSSQPVISKQPVASPRRIVVLSKEVSSAVHIHHHYARLTLDDQNRLVKLVVSR